MAILQYYLFIEIFLPFTILHTKDYLVRGNKSNQFYFKIKHLFRRMKHSPLYFRSFHYESSPKTNRSCTNLTRLKVCQLKSDILYLGNIKSPYNDPNINEQWYFVKQKQSKHLSHELESLWSRRINGKGVNIAILDGGVDVKHRDLKSNYNEELSYNFIHNSNQIVPSNFGRPTEYAGLTSAVPNNNECGVGAAPFSRFVNLQIFDDEVKFLNDTIIAQAILRKNIFISIYLMNWGYEYNSELEYLPGYSTSKALRTSLVYGRGRQGGLFLVGSGMFGSIGNNCAFRSYPQRPEVFVIGAISHDKSPTDYTEPCTAVLAVALSTKTMRHPDLMYSTTWGNLCEHSIGGIAASTSIAAGIIALLIGENRNLTVRQVQTLIVLTSTQYDPTSTRNRAGFYYSYYFGFGMLDANKLVKSSRDDTILYMKNQNKCKTILFNYWKEIKPNRSEKFYFYTAGCLDSSFCVTRIEQTFLFFTLSVFKRNSVTIYLTSPSGTTFKVIQPRYFDTSNQGFQGWRVKIMGYFWERPLGVWILEIISINYPSVLKIVEISFYGECRKPFFNVMSHSNVLDFVSKNIIMRQDNLAKVLFPYSGYKYSESDNRDVCSFSDIQFHLIGLINNII